MRDQLIASLKRVMAKGFNFHAGDLVVLVDEVSSTQTSLLTVDWSSAKGSAEGLQVFAAGIEEQETRPLVFLKDYLDAAGVTLHGQQHFLILGERWDYVPDRPIVNQAGTSTASSTIVWCEVRKAAEKIGTEAGSEFGFNLGD